MSITEPIYGNPRVAKFDGQMLTVKLKLRHTHHRLGGSLKDVANDFGRDDGLGGDRPPTSFDPIERVGFLVDAIIAADGQYAGGGELHPESVHALFHAF